ncbi:hypothetical protein [Streptomyces zinciresistens]|uniref:hypothetical protein n=1 Tax=Streptomyces zinciresistens TaxID=1073330 RepID=UPI00111291DA|nr:hypothetical protein [Streptomyces zinciresistens]
MHHPEGRVSAFRRSSLYVAEKYQVLMLVDVLGFVSIPIDRFVPNIKGTGGQGYSDHVPKPSGRENGGIAVRGKAVRMASMCMGGSAGQ